MSRLVPSASICATSWARLEPETPSTATMVAMPSATPTADSAARAGLLTRPSTASGQRSAGRSRLTGHGAERAIILPRCRAPRTRRAAGSPGARPRAISGLWVTTRIVAPPRFSSASRVRMPALVAESRLPVGSSARMMAGRPASALAMATRWHSPPDSSAGRWPARPDRPTSASASAAAARRSRAGIPRYSSPVATLSSAVSVGTRKNCWNTNPIRSARTPDNALSGSPSTASPATLTLPAVGRSRVPAMASIVDLPDPDGPTIAVNSPVPIVTVTDLSAATGGDPGCSLDTPMSSRALAVPFTGPPPPWSRPRCPPR